MNTWYGLAFAAGFLVALIWDALCKVIKNVNEKEVGDDGLTDV